MAALSESQLPALFRLLIAVLERDRGPSGFSGALAIGWLPRHTEVEAKSVEQLRESALWMHVTLRANEAPRTILEDRLLPSVDAVLLLGEVEAAAMVAGEAFPDEPRLWVSGDRKLLDGFVARYLRHQSGLSLRVQAAVEPSKPKRRR